jgi:hypothetical protein
MQQEQQNKKNSVDTMAQQTAVEWLANELPQPDWSDPFWKLKLEQAKAMEKEQIIKAASTVLWNNSSSSIEQAEQYYIETFKK